MMTIRRGILFTTVAALSAISSATFAVTPNPVTTTPTAQEQSTKTTDAELTRKIRSELMSRDLSTQAKNVTIVTIDGMVTIKGTVPSAQEKAAVGEVATRLAPNVRNEIVVKQ
jgi:hyperosmotically inducible periplasmic protein